MIEFLNWNYSKFWRKQSLSVLTWDLVNFASHIRNISATGFAFYMVISCLKRYTLSVFTNLYFNIYREVFQVPMLYNAWPKYFGYSIFCPQRTKLAKVDVFWKDYNIPKKSSIFLNACKTITTDNNYWQYRRYFSNFVAISENIVFMCRVNQISSKYTMRTNLPKTLDQPIFSKFY